MGAVFKLVAACLLAGTLTAHARADELWLANGDRLTGEVVRKEGEKLLFKTSYAGEMKITWSEVVRVKTDKPMSLVLSDQTLTKTNEIIAAEPERKPEAAHTQARSEAEGDTPVRASQVAYINADPGLNILGIRWKGRLNIGASGNRGNSVTDSVHVDGEAIARRQRDRMTLAWTYDRAKDRDVLSKQNSLVSGKYDLFINKVWYGYGLLNLENDKFRDIDLRTTVGAGIGHQLIESDDMNLSIEGGLNHVNTKFYVASDESYPGARWALKFDQRLFGTDLQFFHGHELVVDLSQSDRTFLKTQTGLRLPLMQRLLATAQFNADYDNAPAPGKEKADYTYLFTVGYHW